MKHNNYDEGSRVEPHQRSVSKPDQLWDPETRRIYNQFRDFIESADDLRTTDVDEFMAFINQLFPIFQKDVTLKLDIQALIKESAISCTGASLILGVWYELIFNRLPVYLIETPTQAFSPRAYDHVVVFLPDNDVMLADKWDGLSTFVTTTDLDRRGNYFEFQIDPGLNRKMSRMRSHRRLTGNLLFIEDRMEAIHGLLYSPIWQQRKQN